jgi:DNA-binding PadR family transcriptional regulator
VGWLTSAWEDIDPAAAGRPARRYYRLTAQGAGEAQAALAKSWRAPTRVIAHPLPGTS